jgi:delta-like protein
VNGYQCNCPSFYSGTTCGRLLDQCTGIDCLNDGRCTISGTKLICLCATGYQGDNCELITDYCQSQPVGESFL